MWLIFVFVKIRNGRYVFWPYTWYQDVSLGPGDDDAPSWPESNHEIF